MLGNGLHYADLTGPALTILGAAMIVGRMEVWLSWRCSTQRCGGVEPAGSAAAIGPHSQKSEPVLEMASPAIHTGANNNRGPRVCGSSYNLRLKNGCRETEPAGRVPQQCPQGQGTGNDLPDERRETAGVITWFDNFCVLPPDGQSQLVYKYAISTVMPSQPITSTRRKITDQRLADARPGAASVLIQDGRRDPGRRVGGGGEPSAALRPRGRGGGRRCPRRGRRACSGPASSPN